VTGVGGVRGTGGDWSVRSVTVWSVPLLYWRVTVWSVRDWRRRRGASLTAAGVTETSHLDFQNDLTVYYDPHRAGALSYDVRLTSVCHVHRPKSRTERPRKTKIGTEVGHVTRDSDTTFKVKGQLAGGGAYCGGLPHILF